MQIWDWLIVVVVLVFVTYTAISTKKYTRTVADFLAANRCAGRYLLGTAEGTAGLGAISVVAGFEAFYVSGWAPSFWGAISIPLMIFIALSGFVIYRYRQTRAMTMSQFFEMRYSRRFRVFTGMLAWISGVVNFGIFPGVGARFFVNFCGLPHWNVDVDLWFLGTVEISLMLAIVMFILLSLALFFTFIGGQIAVLVTDFWQGFIALLAFVGITGFLWFKFPWEVIQESMLIASEPGKSLVDPFDIGSARDFNVWYFAIGWFFNLYQFKAWQGSQGYNCSARTAHEAKMSSIVGGLRAGMIGLGLILMPLAVIVVMNHPDYSELGRQLSGDLQSLFSDNPRTQEQMRVPYFLSRLLPAGLLGAFAASMLGFFISTHNTYLHSWGSIFIQDVLLPLRKKEMPADKHLRYLRYSICGVAVFIFIFSLLMPPTDYIFMYFAITGAIYVGGAGAVILGGLYWKRGTTAGAWVAMIVGSTLSVSAIISQQVWPHIPDQVAAWHNLEVGHRLQLECELTVDEGWPGSYEAGGAVAEGDDVDVPEWYRLSEGVVCTMTEFKVGDDVPDALPEAVLMTVGQEDTEVYSGAAPVVISRMLAEPGLAKKFVFQGTIERAFGDSYYLVSDGEATVVAKICPRFPMNGQVLAFWCAIASIICYVMVSLLTKREDINFDQLFHRGEYAIKDEEEAIKERNPNEKPLHWAWKMIGVNSHEFSAVDKGLFAYTFLMGTVWGIGSFIVLNILQMNGFMNSERWVSWWRIGMLITLAIAFIGGAWVSIGGLFDLKAMYRRLGSLKRDEKDDGRVIGHRSAADLADGVKETF